MVLFKGYIDRVLNIVYKIYPGEKEQITALLKAYESQIPEKVTIAQVNKAIKVATLILTTLEDLKADIEDEEDDIEDAGINEV